MATENCTLSGSTRGLQPPNPNRRGHPGIRCPATGAVGFPFSVGTPRRLERGCPPFAHRSFVTWGPSPWTKRGQPARHRGSSGRVDVTPSCSTVLGCRAEAARRTPAPASPPPPTPARVGTSSYSPGRNGLGCRILTHFRPLPVASAGCRTSRDNERAKFAEPRLIRPRLGQGAFRELVTDIYARRCAVTRERTLPALEAAHIRPYADGGRHEAHNGLLLRRDIHSLFDHGYVTVTPEMRFEVSGRIREKFENGRDYYALHGKGVAVPERSVEQPAKHALEWHNDRVFLG